MFPVLLPDLLLGLTALAVFVADVGLPARRAGRWCYHLTWVGLLTVLGAQLAVAGDEFRLGNYQVRAWTVPFRLAVLVASLLGTVLLHAFFSGRIKRDIIRAPGVLLTLLLVVTMGGFVVSASQDLITFVVGLEMATIPLYAMASFSRDRESAEASVKYLLVGGLSTAFMLFGCSYLYGAAGALDFAGLAAGLADAGILADVGMLLIVGAIAFKLGAVPFHMWAPDVYAGAPSAVTALIASGSKATGILALLLLLDGPLAPVAERLDLLLMILAVSSLVVGNLGALQQRHFPRFMAYSSIAQAGFILLAFLGDALTKPALAFFILVYVLANFTAFIVFNILAERRDESMRALHGLSRQSPLVALALLVAMFSLAGIPPFGGFLGKLQLLFAAAEGTHYLLVAFAAANALVGLYYYIVVVREAYAVEPQGDCQDLAITFPQRFALVLLVIGLILSGVWNGPHTWVAGLCGG